MSNRPMKCCAAVGNIAYSDDSDSNRQLSFETPAAVYEFI